MVKSGVELLLKSSGVTLVRSTNGRVLLCNNHAEIAGAAVSFSTFPSLFSLLSLSVQHYNPKAQMFLLLDSIFRFFLLR